MKKLIAIITCFSLNIAQAVVPRPLFLVDKQVLDLSRGKFINKNVISSITNGNARDILEHHYNKLINKIEKQAQPEYGVLFKTKETTEETKQNDNQKYKPTPEQRASKQFQDNVIAALSKVKIIDLSRNDIYLNDGNLTLFLEKLEEKNYLCNLSNIELVDLSWNNNVDAKIAAPILKFINLPTLKRNGYKPFFDLRFTKISMINILNMLQSESTPYDVKRLSNQLIFVVKNYYSDTLRDHVDLNTFLEIKDHKVTDARYAKFLDAINSKNLAPDFCNAHEVFFYQDKSLKKLKKQYQEELEKLKKLATIVTLASIAGVGIFAILQTMHQVTSPKEKLKEVDKILDEFAIS